MMADRKDIRIGSGFIDMLSGERQVIVSRTGQDTWLCKSADPDEDNQVECETKFILDCMEKEQQALVDILNKGFVRGGK